MEAENIEPVYEDGFYIVATDHALDHKALVMPTGFRDMITRTLLAQSTATTRKLPTSPTVVEVAAVGNS